MHGSEKQPVPISSNNDQVCIKNKNILIILSSFSHFIDNKGRRVIWSAGGRGAYIVNLYKQLWYNHYHAHLLIINDIPIKEQLESENIPYSFTEILYKKNTTPLATQLYEKLEELFSQQHFDIIHCHRGEEIVAAKKIAAHHPGVHVVTTLHGERQYREQFFQDIDGLITLGPTIAEKIDALNVSQKLKIKTIDFVAPFFNAEKFLHFTHTACKKLFFKKNFNITLDNAPCICCISNFYTTSKNHTVLLKAVSSIIHKHKKLLNLLLAGTGERLKEMQKLAYTLHIQDRVFFLGYTALIPEILYHADIKALTSDYEGFGIVLLEAALMKKPLIGTRGTGAEYTITHERTGLLFNKNDVVDLTKQILRLLDNKQFAHNLGENAYKNVVEKFLPQKGFERLIQFYTHAIAP